MRRVILLSGIFFSICCCCSWTGFVKGLSRALTTERAVSAGEFLTNMFGKPIVSPSEIRDFQGVETESPGFTNYYLRYQADKEFVLDLVASLPASPSDELVSSTTCQASPASVSEDEFLPSDFNEIGDLEFWHVDKIGEKEYYTCLRLPWSHTILFDKNSDTVYHIVREIQGY